MVPLTTDQDGWKLLMLGTHDYIYLKAKKQALFVVLVTKEANIKSIYEITNY